MGNLLSILKGGGNQNEEPPFNLDIDLNAARPTQEEANVHTYISDVLKPCNDTLDSLRAYTGCGEYIRKAISTPTRETEGEAWEHVLPAIHKLKQYYEMALRLDESFARTIQFLTQSPVTESLEKYAATAKLLAEVLFVGATFDEIKISNPAIQNDFSYYRRTLSKMRMTNPNPQNLVVGDELANRMSLFYAHSTPITKLFIDNGQNLTSKGVPNSEISDCFAVLAAVCYFTVQKNPGAPTNDYFLKVMTTSIVLYDHINPVGAFAKSSSINLKSTVKVIQENGGANAESLMNTLKYSTVHLNDESTSKGMKTLFQ